MNSSPLSGKFASVTEDHDLESASNVFDNESVRTFSWQALNVTVKDRKSGNDITILDSCHGYLEAGQVVALMGPSGSGKTTLLNVLADRSQLAYTGQVQINNQVIKSSEIRHISSFVEQEDALIGSLTVQETIDFTARLSHGMNKRDRKARVNNLLSSLGLINQRDTIVGTPLRKGISGGQKRRLSVAVQLLTAPKVLFLDEPTSGLDSVASFEVMKFISSVAKKHKILVIASIHQPSTSTFELFDSLMLLSKGKTCFFGPTRDVASYFDSLFPIPVHTNPAEYLLELVNTDFVRDEKEAGRVDRVVGTWTSSREHQDLCRRTSQTSQKQLTSLSSSTTKSISFSLFNVLFVLFYRNFIKSYRDFLAYGTRVIMYTGLAIMMGTVWLRLPYTQASIQPFINAIFFGGAFMSFMAVAYTPSIIEDIQILRKEHANRLYGAGSFTLANFLIGLPWLFGITIIFSVVTYWLGNFDDSSARPFWIWVLYLFLDLLAAESLVVLVSAVAFNFVVALAVTAFANGLWMACGGFLVPLGSLNVFWKYVFHYIDYQAYVFQGMMVNQFQNTIYECARPGGTDNDQIAQCMYASDLQIQGQIRGTAVLDAYHISHRQGIHGEWIGIMIGIIVVYRLLGYGALVWRAKTV